MWLTIFSRGDKLLAIESKAAIVPQMSVGTMVKKKAKPKGTIMMN